MSKVHFSIAFINTLTTLPQATAVASAPVVTTAAPLGAPSRFSVLRPLQDGFADDRLGKHMHIIAFCPRIL